MKIKHETKVNSFETKITKKYDEESISFMCMVVWPSLDFQENFSIDLGMASFFSLILEEKYGMSHFSLQQSIGGSSIKFVTYVQFFRSESHRKY